MCSNLIASFKNKVVLSAIWMLFVLSSFNSQAQNFEWLKTLHFNSGIYVVGEVATKDGGSVQLFSIQSNPDFPNDTVRFDTFQFVTQNRHQLRYCLVKSDSSGNITLVKSISQLFLKMYNSSYGYANLMHMVTDNEENLYTIGYLGDTLNIVGKDTLNLQNGRLVVAKFDKHLEPVYTSQFSNDSMYNIFPNNGFAYGYWGGGFRDTRLFFTGQNLYAFFSTKGSLRLAGKNFNFGQNLTQIYCEINPTDGTIKWSDFFYSGNFYPEYNFNISGMTRLNNRLYFSGSFGFSDNKDSIILIKGDTFHKPGGFVIATDTMGTYLSRVGFHNGYTLHNRDIAHDQKNLYICGTFRDSLKWGDTMIPPEFPSGKYPKGRNSVNMELFAASLTPDLQHRWFFRPHVLDVDTFWTANSGQLARIFSANGFLYFGGSISLRTEINQKIYGSNRFYWPNVFLFKMDNIGNILWASDGKADNHAFITEMAVIPDRSIFASGSFKGKITFGKYHDSSRKYISAFHTKITDYSITRGAVSAGPYCAGDSILVPFSIIGTFDSANQFIAELSDEFGNFHGSQKELGRKSSITHDTIVGILPLFQVKSSPHYRIRVRSTEPAVQSYYILDTLRLLIYSKDKADPGPPDTICYRDTLQLNTFGGTKWTWSPAYLIDDSTLRSPRIWPEKDTAYQLIIADSSGCGAPDTAFKSVVVRQRPRLYGDTVVYKCPETYLRVKLYVTHSDSGHTIRWYRNNKLYFTGDSLFYVEDASVTLTAILKDHCSPVTDTLVVRVRYNAPSRLTEINDTSLCYGTSLPLFASANSGFGHVFRWFNAGRSFIATGSPVMRITASDSFLVVLSDACNLKADSAWKHVYLNGRIHPDFSDILPADSLFCADFNLTLSPKGAHVSDSIRWIEIPSGLTLGSESSLLRNTPGKVKVQVENLCGSTTDSIVIDRKNTPEADIDPLFVPCQGNVLTLHAGTFPEDVRIRWSTADTSTLLTLNTDGGYWISASNACGSDTAFFKVQFIPKPKANFNNSDVCEGAVFELVQTGSGGQSFLWRLGDGTVSNDSNAIHTYPRTGQARTYLVSFKASASKDCADSITLPINVLVSPSANFTYRSNGRTVYFEPDVTPSGASYRWTLGDGDSSNLSAPSHTYEADSGTYTVCLRVTNAENCTQMVCNSVYFNVGIEELEKGIRVYPNPAEKTLYLESISSYPILQVILQDLQGRILYLSDCRKSHCEIDVSGLSKGMYMLSVQTERGIWKGKVEVGR